MKITSVIIPQELLRDIGLKTIEMRRLEQFVVLAGKNGSGKSRILEKISEYLKNKPGEENIKNAKSVIEQLRSQLKQPPPGPPGTYSTSQVQEDIKRINLEIDRLQAIINFNFIEVNQSMDGYDSFKFVPKSLQLDDPFTLSGNEIERRASTVDNIGIQDIHMSTFAKIQSVQNRWANAAIDGVQAKEEDIHLANTEYSRLQELVKVFLNTDLQRDLEGRATLFGLPLGESRLSEGQKVILQLCVALFSQEKKLNELVIIMDEPENHLHPSALIQLFERLKQANPNGQIWIATHSIPLLAYFDTGSLWFVEENEIKFAGRIPEKVLRSLVGDEFGIEKIHHFLGLPAQFASTRFAFESLLQPYAVTTEPKDPQSGQILEALEKLTAEQPINVLDYGAGKGRSLANIFDYSEAAQEVIKDRVNYVAFDEFNIDKDDCLKVIELVYGNVSGRYYNNISQLSKDKKGNFNVVVMCNVLHEIEPQKWLALFSKEGIITNLLEERGSLLILEVSELVHGEKPYQRGFLVFDCEELQILFKVDSKHIITSERQNGRLKCHSINKEHLFNVTIESIQSALVALSARAKNEILHTRSQEASYKNGLKHGFWVQQFANAQLNLDSLKVDMKT